MHDERTKRGGGSRFVDVVMCSSSTEITKGFVVHLVARPLSMREVRGSKPCESKFLFLFFAFSYGYPSSCSSAPLSNPSASILIICYFRHFPNTGSRKSWAAGDATSRGVRLALMSLKGEMGYKTALSAPKWGFYDVLFKGQPLKFQRPFEEYVMENVLFKVSFPAVSYYVYCPVWEHKLICTRNSTLKLLSSVPSSCTLKSLLAWIKSRRST
jgi:hypothetical protein